MRRLLALLVLTLGLVPVGGGTAWACSCRGAPDDEADFRLIGEFATAVYVGEVVGPLDTRGTVAVRIERSLKGHVAGVRFVKSPEMPHGCGPAPLERGRVFLVELAGGWMAACFYSTQGPAVDDRAAAYQRYNPVDPAGDDAVRWIAVSLACGVLAASILLARRRQA